MYDDTHQDQLTDELTSPAIALYPSATDEEQAPQGWPSEGGLDRIEFACQRQRTVAEMFGIQLDAPRLGKYVLLDELGRGGMGVVYAAYDPELDRKVAIKVLRSQRHDKLKDRFNREAKAMARLNHPNAVHVYEVAKERESTFIVMEYVEGETLTHWLEQHEPSQAEILEVFEAAGRGLVAVHHAGLVHRDFKPDNVMIREDGRVLVMDFGLAGGEFDPTMPQHSARERAPSLTHTGAVMGTPVYMAPEQWLGSNVSASADQFSFCVSLWEALTGERPFAAKDYDSLRDAVTSGAERPGAAAGIPQWLRPVLRKGLQVEPTKRFGSMHELLEAVRADPTRRRRKLFTTISLVTAVGAVVGGLVCWQQHMADLLKTELLDNYFAAVEDELDSQVFEPIDDRLTMTVQHVASGHLDLRTETKRLNPYFVPILRHAREAELVVMANELGEQYALWQSAGDEWISRAVTRDGLTIEQTWAREGQIEKQRTITRDPRYHPHKRPWWALGKTLRDDGSEHAWTALYEFYTTGSKGLTNVAHIGEYVIGFDLALKDISEVTMNSLNEVEGAQAFVLDEKEHRLLGQPREAACLDLKNAPPRLSELTKELPVSSAAARACSAEHDGKPYGYELAGERYWAYCKASDSPGHPDLRIGVVVPDAHFQSRAWIQFFGAIWD